MSAFRVVTSASSHFETLSSLPYIALGAAPYKTTLRTYTVLAQTKPSWIARETVHSVTLLWAQFGVAQVFGPRPVREPSRSRKTLRSQISRFSIRLQFDYLNVNPFEV